MKTLFQWTEIKIIYNSGVINNMGESPDEKTRKMLIHIIGQIGCIESYLIIRV